MSNFESIKKSVKYLIRIGKKVDFFSTESEEIQLKRDSNLTTHQTPNLHPEVQRLLKFDTIQNLYYPEAFAPVEATTVEEFNQNTNNNLDYAYIHRNTEAYDDMIRRILLAFVLLDDIHIMPGHYKPESEEGRKLLTHELTHVAQNKNKEFVDHRTRKELEEEAEFNERTAESIQDPLVTRTIRGEEVTLPASRWHEVSTEVLDVLVPEWVDYERFKRSPEGYELLKRKYAHWKEHHEDEYRW
ncbi:MAG: DUF4157 domain-containing protein [Treponema sp.]|nr:DUF4157 domain-containing protein [Treponema sp.]